MINDTAVVTNAMLWCGRENFDLEQERIFFLPRVEIVFMAGKCRLNSEHSGSSMDFFFFEIALSCCNHAELFRIRTTGNFKWLANIPIMENEYQIPHTSGKKKLPLQCNTTLKSIVISEKKNSHVKIIFRQFRMEFEAAINEIPKLWMNDHRVLSVLTLPYFFE